VIQGAFEENPYPQRDPQCSIVNVEVGQSTCTNAIIRAIDSDAVFNPDAKYDMGLCIVPWDFIYLKQFVVVRSVNQISFQYSIEERNQGIVANYTAMPMNSG
jgi:hypothetical protein